MRQRILCAVVVATMSGLIFLGAVQAAQTKRAVAVKLNGKKVASGTVGSNWTTLYATKSGYKALARLNQGRLETKVLDAHNRRVQAVTGTNPPPSNPNIKLLCVVDLATGEIQCVPIPEPPDPGPGPDPEPELAGKLKVPARK